MSETEWPYLIVALVLVVFCIAGFVIACATAPNGNINGSKLRPRK